MEVEEEEEKGVEQEDETLNGMFQFFVLFDSVCSTCDMKKC